MKDLTILKKHSGNKNPPEATAKAQALRFKNIGEIRNAPRDHMMSNAAPRYLGKLSGDLRSQN